MKEGHPPPRLGPKPKALQAAEQPANVQAVICLGRVNEEDNSLHLAKVAEVDLLQVGKDIVPDPPVRDERSLGLVHDGVRCRAPPTGQGPSHDFVVGVQQRDGPVAGWLVAGQPFALEEESDDPNPL